MNFRFYSNMMSQASRNFAYGSFITGLMLIGIGFLIWVLRELFAILFAVLFCIGGLGCIGFAIKVFLASVRLGKFKNQDPHDQRVNVRIRTEEHQDY